MFRRMRQRQHLPVPRVGSDYNVYNVYSVRSSRYTVEEQCLIHQNLYRMH